MAKGGYYDPDPYGQRAWEEEQRQRGGQQGYGQRGTAPRPGYGQGAPQSPYGQRGQEPSWQPRHAPETGRRRYPTAAAPWSPDVRLGRAQPQDRPATPPAKAAAAPLASPAPAKAPAISKAKTSDKPSGKAWVGCLGVILVPAVLITWFVVAAGNGSSGSPSPIPAPTVPTSPPMAPGTAPDLTPLTLGQFPDTADGQLARGICGQWQGLRQKYVYRLTIDNSYQMNGWFSSSAWDKVQADALNLDDPAFSNLETALGVAMDGEDASDVNAAAVDKACEDAD